MNQTCDISGKQLRQVLWRENLEVTWTYLYRWLKQVRSLLFVHKEKKLWVNSLIGLPSCFTEAAEIVESFTRWLS